MKFFESTAEKEAERRATFGEWLQSDEACQILFERFTRFFYSGDGRYMVLKLFTDARLREDLEATSAAVKRQLTAHVDAGGRQLRAQIDAEITDLREVISRLAADTQRDLKNSL